MSTCARECTEDTPLKDVYEHIQACEHGFVVVVDSTSHRVPIGIVTEHSICEQIIARGRNAKALFAGSVMSTNVKRVGESAPVANCREVLSNNPDAILVVDDQRRLSGIIEPKRLKALIGEPHPVAGRVVEGANASFVRKIPATNEIPAFGWLK